MSVIRAIVLKDASVTAAATCGDGTAYDLGLVETGKIAFAVIHRLSSALNLGPRCTIMSGSSSGFTVANPGTSRFGFDLGTGAVTCRGSEWLTPILGPSATCQSFWRLEWSAQGTVKFLVWMSISC